MNSQAQIFVNEIEDRVHSTQVSGAEKSCLK